MQQNPRTCMLQHLSARCCFLHAQRSWPGGGAAWNLPICTSSGEAVACGRCFLTAFSCGAVPEAACRG